MSVSDQIAEVAACCPACGSLATSDERRSVVDERGVERRYRQCADCGHVWFGIMPDPVELGAYYEDSYYGSGETKFPKPVERFIDAFRHRRAVRLAKACPADARRLLDIGCGSGAFLRVIGDAGLEIHGIELPGSAADRAARIPGIHLHVGTLANFPNQMGPFGIVTLWHVLEHMPNPQASLIQIRSLLCEDGLLYIDVPNGDSWQSKWFGVDWFHRDPPRHLHQFTPSSIRHMLETAGFTCVELKSQQQEMGLYGMLQSLNDRLVSPRLALYSLLRMRGRLDVSLFRKLLVVLIAVLLFPLVVLLSLLEAFAGRAAVLSVVASKAKGEGH